MFLALLVPLAGSASATAYANDRPRRPAARAAQDTPPPPPLELPPEPSPESPPPASEPPPPPPLELPPVPAPESQPPPESPPPPASMEAPPAPTPVVRSPPASSDSPVWSIGMSTADGPPYLAAYDNVFYEFGYTYETVPWLTGNATTPIALSGVSYYENRGFVGNAFLAAVFAVGAVAGNTNPQGTYNADRTIRADARATEAGIGASALSGAGIVARDRIFAMGLRFYSDATASQMTGWIFDFNKPFVFGGNRFSLIPGIQIAALWTNRNFQGAAFGTGWFGVTLGMRVALMNGLNFRLDTEIIIRDLDVPVLWRPMLELTVWRLQIRGGATLSTGAPFPDSVGGRIEAGVRF